MTFDNVNGVLKRLDDKKPLCDDEHRALYQWLTEASDQNRRILDLEMTRRLLDALNESRSAIQRFDESSRKLTRWLIGLTAVLIILTIVIAAFTILLWRRG